MILCLIFWNSTFSGEDDNTSDYIMEGMLKSMIHSSRITVKNPLDYEARSNIMWIATWALNTLVAKGKTTDWEVHMIGQSIGAYTNATHGMTLSAVSLPYYRFPQELLFRMRRHGLRFEDSRYWGFVPEEYIVGVVDRVVESHHPVTGANGGNAVD